MARTAKFLALLMIPLVSSLIRFHANGAEQSDAEIAQAAFAIFSARCQKCHGPGESNSADMLLDREAMVGAKKVIPGKPDESVLYELARETDPAGRRMPPVGDPLKSEEIAVIKKWIERGAPNWEIPKADR